VQIKVLKELRISLKTSDKIAWYLLKTEDYCHNLVAGRNNSKMQMIV